MNRDRLILTILGAALLLSIAIGLGRSMSLEARAERERKDKESERAARETAETRITELEGEKADLQLRLDGVRTDLGREVQKREDAEGQARQIADAALVRRYEAQVTQQLDTITGMMIANGLAKTHTYQIGSLRVGETKSFPVRLQPGRYIIVASCDNDCQDVDLAVYDVSGRLISSDIQADDKPAVGVVVQSAGEASVVVRMHRCRTQVCWFGIGIYGRSA
jgi:hypothetical protein